MKYDVFLSSKSEDYGFADEVYNFLTSHGLKVFLASKELEKIGEAQYAKVIETEIDESLHMIVVGSSIDYIKSTWVEREWRQFCNDLFSGYRTGNIMTILSDDINKRELPGSLRHQQSFSMSSYYESILGFLKGEIQISKPLVENEKDWKNIETPQSDNEKDKKLFDELVDNFKINPNRREYIQKIEKLLSHAPHNIDYLWLAYDIYAANDRKKSCERCFNDIKSIDSYDPQVLLIGGYELVEQGNFKGAQQVFESIVTQKRVDPKIQAYAYNNIAACFIMADNFEEAERASSYAISFLKNPPILENLAYAQFKQGKISEAWDNFEELLDISKKHDTAYFYLALCNQKVKNHSQSISYLIKVLENNNSFLFSNKSIDEFLDGMYGKRYCLIQRGGGWVETVHHNEAYKSVKSEYIEILTNLSEAFSALNDSKHMYDCYKTILPLDKTNAKAIEVVCGSNNILPPPLERKFCEILNEAKECSNDPYKALKILSKIENANDYQPHFDVMSFKGKLLCQIGNDEESMRILEASLSQNPHQADSSLLLASLYEQDNNYQEAIRLCNYVLSDIFSSDTDILFANNNLGVLLNRIGEHKKASECYDSVMKMGYSAEIFFNKGFSLYKCLQYNEAVEYFDKAISENNDLYYECLPFIVCCYVGLQRNDKASEYLEKALFELLDEEAKDIIAYFNSERYYYYGVFISSSHITSPNIDNHKEFFINVALCIGHMFESMDKRQQAQMMYEYILTIDENNYSARASLRRMH